MRTQRHQELIEIGRDNALTIEEIIELCELELDYIKQYTEGSK